MKLFLQKITMTIAFLAIYTATYAQGDSFSFFVDKNGSGNVSLTTSQNFTVN